MPGFDSDGFDDGFDTVTAVDESTGTNDRRGLRWYTCGVCDRNYPEDKVIVFNGRITCIGDETLNCVDKRGYAAERKQVVVPIEQKPEPLPTFNEDL